MPEAKETEANVPRGANGEPIQVLSPVESTVATVAIGAGNASTALPAGATVVEVAVGDTCRFEFGTSAVDATVGTKRMLLAGVYVYRVPAGATHFAATRFSDQASTITVARLQ